LNALVGGAAEQARRDCSQLLESLVQDFRLRCEQAIPLADLQALAARMRAKPEESP